MALSKLKWHLLTVTFRTKKDKSIDASVLHSVEARLAGHAATYHAPLVTV